jgi:hypothetical protein
MMRIRSMISLLAMISNAALTTEFRHFGRERFSIDVAYAAKSTAGQAKNISLRH